MPTCCGCGLAYPKNVFAKSQLKKPPNRRRCLGCVAEAEDAAGAAAAPAQQPNNPFDGLMQDVSASSSGGGASSKPSAPSSVRDTHYKISASALKLLDSLLEAGRMSEEDYHAAKLSARATKQEDALLAEWQPYSLSLPCRVQMHRLVGRQDLNGRHGTATSWLKDAGRYCVQLNDRGDTVAIRPANLTIVGDGRSTDPGRCWNGYPWGAGLLRCDGRLPVHGEVSCIIDGPYPNMTEREYEELEAGSGRFDRRAVASVFTFEGYLHIFKSPDLGGTSMLVQSAKVEIEPHLKVIAAYPVNEKGERLLVVGLDEEAYIPQLALFDYPQMDLLKLWTEDDGDEFRDYEIRLVDYFEEVLAITFVSKGRADTERLCCYQYHDRSEEDDSSSFLTKFASWELTDELRKGHGRISDLCVNAGGYVGASVATLSYNGLVRIWNTDSPAGCVAILNGSLERLGPPGKVAGLTADDSGPGAISRVPLIMQHQISSHFDLDDDSVGVVTSHNGTLSFWRSALNEYRAPSRVLAMTNPMAAAGSQNSGLTIDKGLSNGVCVQVGDMSYVSEEDGSEWDVTQLAVWSPFRKAAPIAFEIPEQFEVSSDGVCFCGGRLLIAGGLLDGGKSSKKRSGYHEFGNETCYLYVVTGREEEVAQPRSQRAKPRLLGIDSRQVPGLLGNLLASPSSVEDMPKGLNLSMALAHMDLPGDPPVEPPEVRPCCFACHGCGSICCLGELRPCSGCRSALYCSKQCQKNSWEMHKPTCKGLQSVKKWLLQRGIGCDGSRRIF